MKTLSVWTVVLATVTFTAFIAAQVACLERTTSTQLRRFSNRSIAARTEAGLAWE
jgi:hypothetical protein